MAGRQSRFDGDASSLYKDLDYNEKRLMDKERYYLKKMMNVKDEYNLAQSYLGRNLCRRDGFYPGIGLGHLKQAFTESPGVQKICRNLARHYRKNGRVEDAIDILERDIKQKPQSAQHLYQLALCYEFRAKKEGTERNNLLEIAVRNLDKCLKLDEGHMFANLRKAKALTLLGRKEEAKNLYETLLQSTSDITLQDQIILYFNYTEFLSQHISREHEQVVLLWHKVMETAEALEYQDEESGRWQVVGKAKKPKRKALASLWLHYQRIPRNHLKLAILLFQNFDFQGAETKLFSINLSNRKSVASWKYLALTYLKWGLQNAAIVRAEMSEPQKEILEKYFKKARESVIQARNLGLDVNEGRKLLADITLQIAHNQSQLADCSNCNDEEKRQLKSSAIESYRQAVRCGSLSSSFKLLELVVSGKENTQISSRWELLQILAEIYVCCSQRPPDCLQAEPSRSWRHSEAHSSEEDCKKVKMTIEGIISAHEFFREAWTNHFDMERRILFKLFQSRNGELVMDGRIGDPSTKEMSSQEIVTAAITCCSALRKLLDRIIDRFKKEELNIRTEKNNYFNLLRNDPSVTKEALQKNLETNLGIDMADHYPKLFENLLKLQLRSHSEAQFWNDFIKLVNLDKHTNTERAKLLELVSNPVALARECSDKVEEICNYFLETIEESKSLKRRVDKLISGIKGGEQGSARVLVGVLKDNPDFVVRMGSTCRLLKMMALIDNLGSPNQETTDAYLTVVRGKFTSSHALRCSHLDMETSLLSTDIMKKCKDTCSEAKKMLDGALSSVKDKLLRAGRNSPEPDAATEPVSFPLPDLDLKTVIPASWKKKVKKKLKTDLDDMGITNGPSKDKLLDILLKAQPCSSDDNYKFKAMFNFIKNGEPDDNGKVHITTYSGEDKGYDVLELTRWCTDNSERIAMQLDDLCRNIDNA